MAKKRTRGNPVPLIVEEYPENYTGYPFITLIQYRKEHFLTIVDNATDKFIKAFVLDLCGPEKVDEEKIIAIAAEWYESKSKRYPISFEFSRLGISAEVEKINKRFNTEFVTRIIGPLPRFEMGEAQKIRRRRRKPVPEGMEIHHKKIVKIY